MKLISSQAGVLVTILCAGALTVSAAAERKALILENNQLSLSIKSDTGGIAKLHNKLSGETYRIDDPGFLIELGTGNKPVSLGRFRPVDCKIADAFVKGGEAVIVFTKGEVKITVSYRLDSQDSFAVKRVSVDYSGKDSFNVSRLEMFDWALNPNPAKAIPYCGYLSQRFNVPAEEKETGVPSNSTAFFMRYGEGGVFTAVSCDFVFMHQDERSKRCRSVYWPGLILKPGEVFESEMGLIGVYRRQGLFHKSYSTTAELRRNGFLAANVDARLDRAEIDGIRTAVQNFLKPERYTFLANGWAMGLPSQIATPEAVEQYKKAIDVSQRFPNIEGIHFIDNFGGLSKEFAEHGLDTKYALNPHIREAFDYAGEKGMGLSGFVWASRGQPAPDKPELLILNADGQRNRGGIALTKQYTDFILDTFSRHEEEYPQFMGLTFDFLYFYPDYDPDHGYLPGVGSLHAQWSNMRNLLRRLRWQFPDWMLRTQIGWRQHGPWLAEHSSFVHNSADPNINVQRNFLDFHASYQYANNLRLASWFAANCKMFPRYMMNSFLVHKNVDYDAWDYGAWRYCVLSRIATGSGFGMLNGKPGFAGGEIFPEDQKEFLVKWMDWQRARTNYYSRAASLFGEPRPTGVDAMAYGNGTDSFVFVCNPTFEVQQVALPIGGDIHLPEGVAYTVKELYPEERYRIGLNEGAFDHGALFVTDIPAQTVAVFEVKPVDSRQPYLLGVGGEIEQVDNKFIIQNVTGPTGQKRQFAVRLPVSSESASEVTVAGRTVPMQRDGQLLLGRMQFAGEVIARELFDWKARKTGNKTIFTADFFVPESARKILSRQALPVTEKYRDKEDILNTTAWLDWSRFIIHLPILPEGASPEKAPFLLEAPSVEAHEDQLASFRPDVSLNGKPAALRSNFMRTVERSARRRRWSGFFIDASDSILYGKQNTLALEFPGETQPGYLAAYLPNLTSQTTSDWKLLTPPDKLIVESRPDAADAFPAVPVVRERADGLTLFLRLSITSPGKIDFTGKQIAVEKGTLGKVIPLDPRRHATDNEITSIQLANGNIQACAQFQVDGVRNTRIRLLSGDPDRPGDLCAFTLGEALDAWHSRGDRYDPYAVTLPGTVEESFVTVELVGPMPLKMAVSDSL